MGLTLHAMRGKRNAQNVQTISGDVFCMSSAL